MQSLSTVDGDATDDVAMRVGAGTEEPMQSLWVAEGLEVDAVAEPYDTRRQPPVRQRSTLREMVEDYARFDDARL